MKNFFIALTRNPLSLAGAAITTASAVLFATLFVIDAVGMKGGPYAGIIAYLIVPAIFVVGLLLIPLGISRERRRERAALARGEAAPTFPVLDFNRTETRNRTLIVLALTLVNLVLLATATYKGVETMETTAFCGQACHSVMQPEFAAYQRGAHASVHCVSCHIGPGAGWFVKSKLSGSWQVISVNLKLYPTPIPSPVHNLRPARETCEQCHWPEKFVGDRLKVIDTFADDEPNTALKTVLLMRVGGVSGRSSQGIHWHVDRSNQIRYRSDESRETIYEVELTKADGSVERFLADGAAEGEAAKAGVWRTMDCVDCHNRPSHTFHSPEDEVDLALRDGKIARDLPFVRREGVKLLKAEYPSQEEAEQAIARGLRAYYEKERPELARDRAADIEAAAAALFVGYKSNVFPNMKITWGTYKNHIGHESSPGCWRCHDDAHKSASGRTISQDCSTCHSLLAEREADPQILKTLSP